jgi:hypothetical protein
VSVPLSEHRHVGSTNFNLLSSRSHTIFTLVMRDGLLIHRDITNAYLYALIYTCHTFFVHDCIH